MHVKECNSFFKHDHLWFIELLQAISTKLIKLGKCRQFLIETQLQDYIYFNTLVLKVTTHSG